jgi:hypothetical protein
MKAKGNDRSPSPKQRPPDEKKAAEGGLFSSLSVSDRGQTTQLAPGWPHILVDTARVFTVVIGASPP